MKTVKNASQKPVIYYGLHMSEGVAEYPEHKTSDGKPTRILILENAIKAMDPTFAGCPVYVRHVDDDGNFENIQAEADGYVVESFFNQLDGKHWAKFIVVSDKGHEAIRSGWRLSNAYSINDSKSGGQWHAVDYSREVTKASYGHLAIVPNPRYEESIILTPEQFKAYNSKKELELKALHNSKGDRSMLSKLFKRSKVDNSEEIESTMVTLADGSEKSIKQLINEAETALEKKDEDAGEKKNMANGSDFVNADGEEMTVNALLEKYNAMKKNAEHKEPDADDKKNDDDADADDMENKKKNELAEAEALKIKNAAEAEAARVKAEGEAHFAALKNAPDKKEESEVVETSTDRVARGASRYGSGK